MNDARKIMNVISVNDMVVFEWYDGDVVCVSLEWCLIWSCNDFCHTCFSHGLGLVVVG